MGVDKLLWLVIKNLEDNSTRFCSKHVRISSKCLDDARKCFGTDEDILLVPPLPASPCYLFHGNLKIENNMLSSIFFLVSLEKSGKLRIPSPRLSPNVNIDC
ncbi:hypothetical protein SDJN02_07379, partial [Cucurbita argyrosperma subsp. argyrosperma]